MSIEAILAKDPTDRILGQHHLSVTILDEYKKFEILERGSPWPRMERVVGGVGNAAELSKALENGDENRLSEGHSDVVWSAQCGVHEYNQKLPELAKNYKASLRLYAPIVGDIHQLRAELLEAGIGGQRYAAVLDGKRTLPNPDKAFLDYQAKFLCLADLCLVAANTKHGFAIEPEENFTAGMNILAVRIPLQKVYARLREGELTPAQAQAEADKLARRGTELGIGRAALEDLWKKAPTRVKGQGNIFFALPASVSPWHRRIS